MEKIWECLREGTEERERKMKKTKLYRNGEGYIDKTPGDAIRAAKREPENVIQFRRMLKAMGIIFHLKILGKVVLVDENGDRW